MHKSVEGDEKDALNTTLDGILEDALDSATEGVPEGTVMMIPSCIKRP